MRSITNPCIWIQPRIGDTPISGTSLPAIRIGRRVAACWANRLAIEAIPLFTSFPEGGTLRTIGFTGNRSTNTRWTWPLWTIAIELSVVRSLLLAEELQEESINAKNAALLYARGLGAVYRTRRILFGKTPNFTPAERIA